MTRIELDMRYKNKNEMLTLQMICDLRNQGYHVHVPVVGPMVLDVTRFQFPASTRSRYVVIAWVSQLHHSLRRPLTRLAKRYWGGYLSSH